MRVNLSLWVWVGIAVLAAWAVGAYSRLHRLRENATRARSSLLKYLVRYRDALPAGSVPDSESLLDALRRVAMLSEQWERDVRTTRVPAELGAALEHVRLELDKMRNQPGDLAGALFPPEVLDTWDALMADVTSRRARYNVHVEELNDAIAQAPASFLARLTGIVSWDVL